MPFLLVGAFTVDSEARAPAADLLHLRAKPENPHLYYIFSIPYSIFKKTMLYYIYRGVSAAGSARHWQCRGHGFESRTLHQQKNAFCLPTKDVFLNDVFRSRGT